MLGVITKDSFFNICSNWARIISLPGENLIQIWPPISGPHSLVRQFLVNNYLQQKLFGKIKPKLVLIDADESEYFTFESARIQILNSLELNTKQPEHLTLDSWLSKHPQPNWLSKHPQPVCIFVMGLDTALRNKNLEAINHFGTLIEKYPHFKVILISELNIPESHLFEKLIAKNALLQNIMYQPLFSKEDSIHFLQNLASVWHFTFPEEKMKTIAENMGGHYLLMKEAARLVRDNPKTTVREIFTTPSLMRKGFAVFQKLSKEDQETIRNILLKKKGITISEYLTETKLVVNGDLGIKYWTYIKDNLLNQNYSLYVKEFNLDYYLTFMEHKVFQTLLENKGTVHRDIIAQTIWQKDWEEKYSDWAIDQFIHRIRSKINATQAPYEIVTKKGEGFSIISK